MTQRPRTALAALAVAMLSLTAACGGSTDGAGDTPAASTGTTGPVSSPVAGSTDSAGGDSADGSAAGGDAFAAGSTVDAASIKQMFSDAVASATTVHVDMRMTGQVAMSGSGDMDMAAKPLEASLHLTSSTLGGDLTMLMVDNAMYMKSAMFGAKYVKVSMDDKNSPIGQMGLDSLDPSAMFDRFSDAVSGGTYVGKETVDGSQTDHYRFTIDGKALASAVPSAAAGAAGSIPKTESMDVWFDGDGRYRKMAMKVGAESVTETFSDWGTPVSVKAPPAGEVQDMTKLMNGLGTAK